MAPARPAGTGPQGGGVLGQAEGPIWRIVAAIAAGGAVAAHVAAEGSPVAAAARTFWKADARCVALISNPSHTDEEWDEVYWPWSEAFDRMMEIPSSSTKDLAMKVQVCRKFWGGCEIDMDDPEQFGGLLADIERLAMEVQS